MIWDRVSFIINLNEEYLAREIILGEKDLAEELGYDLWNQGKDYNLEEDLWNTFKNSCFELFGLFPILRTDEFNRSLDFLVPKPNISFHLSYSPLVYSSAIDYISMSSPCDDLYIKYVNYFTEKGVWRKALLSEKEFLDTIQFIKDATRGA